MRITLTVDERDAGRRLDIYLANRQDAPELRSLSRSRFQQLIRDGHVRLIGRQECKANHRICAGEQIVLDIPDPVPLQVQPEPIPLNIVYQDAHLAVIDKPAGLVVHPAGRNVSGTVVNALLHHLKDLSGIGGVLRPGIVHRLDKGTSGLLLVAKTDEAHTRLSKAFKDRRIKKTYLALVQGRLSQPRGRIDFPMARHRTQRHKMAAVLQSARQEEPSRFRPRKTKNALTHFELQKAWDPASLVIFRPETGRTHQIRVHVSQIGHPVLGDSTYGYRWEKSARFPKLLVSQLNGPALHAWRLELDHPTTGEPLRFEAPVPERLQKIIDYLDQMG